MNPPVSAFIITLNEADRIGRTIESLRGCADEIIVVDSGSTDGTQEAAAKLGAKVMFNPWPGYGPQKRFAEAQCRHDWLLNLDADEVLDETLRSAVRALFADGRTPPHAAYALRIRDVLPGERAPSRFAHTVSPVRLYDRRHGRYAESAVHDRVRMESGETGTLPGTVLHFSTRSLAHAVDKLNRYSSMQAADMLARKKGRVRFLRLKLICIFPLAFLKAYFLRGYATRGTAGFITSTVYAFSRFARLAKAWEAGRGRMSDAGD